MVASGLEFRLLLTFPQGHVRIMQAPPSTLNPGFGFVRQVASGLNRAAVCI